MASRTAYLLALPSPTYTFSGLSLGNQASMRSLGNTSSPRQLALQQLDLCMQLHHLGQTVLLSPPHERPALSELRNLGFSGSDADVQRSCAKHNPALLELVCSSSAIWVANSATFSPSIDTKDRKAHLSIANKASNFHRALEASFSFKLYQTLFRDKSCFICHPALPQGGQVFSDEGAANHLRLAASPGSSGLHLFAYGRHSLSRNIQQPLHYKPRQSSEASYAIARRHGLLKKSCYFLQQQPRTIDEGFFHLDLLALSANDFLLLHEESFMTIDEELHSLKIAMEEAALTPLHAMVVKAARLPLKEALRSYLFNSLPVVLDDGTVTLLAPKQCQTSTLSQIFLEELIHDPNTPINHVIYMDLSQSMANGGGPACLQIRFSLTDKEIAALHPSFYFDEMRYHILHRWVDKHFREQLSIEELADPELLKESQNALEEISQIYKLGSLYSFQHEH